MANTKIRSRDANRFGKKYSRARIPSKPFLMTENFSFIEVSKLQFRDANSYTHTFKTDFPGIPTVTASPMDASDPSGARNLGNVNVWISSLTQFTVTINTSENFYGTVMMQAIYVGD